MYSAQCLCLCLCPCSCLRLCTCMCICVLCLFTVSVAGTFLHRPGQPAHLCENQKMYMTCYHSLHQFQGPFSQVPSKTLLPGPQAYVHDVQTAIILHTSGVQVDFGSLGSKPSEARRLPGKALHCLATGMQAGGRRRLIWRCLYIWGFLKKG